MDSFEDRAARHDRLLTSVTGVCQEVTQYIERRDPLDLLVRASHWTQPTGIELITREILSPSVCISQKKWRCMKSHIRELEGRLIFVTERLKWDWAGMFVEYLDDGPPWLGEEYGPGTAYKFIDDIPSEHSRRWNRHVMRYEFTPTMLSAALASGVEIDQ